MNLLSSLRPTPALIVAMIALVAAMSGAAVALPGKDDVTSNDIADNAVKSKHIVKNAVRSQEVQGKSLKGNDLKDGAINTKQIKDDAIGSAQVEEDGLNDTDIADYEVLGDTAGNLVELTATEGATAAAARAAAPATELFTRGQLTITAKCFHDTGADETYAEMYVGTSADGAIFDGSSDELSGGPAATDFLNVATAEDDRQLDELSVLDADAQMDEGEFTAVAPDGTHLIGQTMVAAKNGTLPGGDGAYGAGNVCLFGGEVAG